MFYCDFISCYDAYYSLLSTNVIIYGIIRICESLILDGGIELLVGLGPGGRLTRLNYDLIRDGFELTEFFTKGHIGDEPWVFIWLRC